jgi:sugar phosphate isomerase/epimerase
MNNKIALIDYDADWALTERNLHPRTSAGYLTREQVIEFFGTLGVEGVELFHAYWDDYWASRLRKLISDAGLSAVTYMSFIDLAFPRRERQAGIDQVYAILDRTREIGASICFNLPFVGKEGVPLAEQRAWVVEGVQTCAERARSLGVTLVCENLDYPPMRPLTGHAAAARDLCNDVNSPAFRLIYDTANPVFVEEDSLTAMRTMQSCIAHVHLKNCRPLKSGEQRARSLSSDGGTSYIGTCLEDGIVQIPAILRELDRIEYNGWLGIEYQGEDDPREALRRNVEYVRGIMSEIPTAG